MSSQCPHFIDEETEPQRGEVIRQNLTTTDGVQCHFGMQIILS